MMLYRRWHRLEYTEAGRVARSCKATEKEKKNDVDDGLS
jgi:hypothetical protein